jgi:DNA-binding transcriptional MerR regulator
MTKKMRMEIGLLKVGEIAREARVLASTIRYYTEVGLLKVKDLTDGGYRLYDREDTLERLRLVKSVNEGHLSLAEVRTQLS